MYEVTRSVYRLATPEDDFPADQIVHLEEAPGEVNVIIRSPHATPEFLADITLQHIPILSYGRWAQDWTGPNGLKASEGRHIAKAAWQTVPDNEMPTGVLCFPVEAEGSFIWMIRESQVSEELIAVFNQILEHIVGDGLWIQRWDGQTSPQQASSGVQTLPRG